MEKQYILYRWNIYEIEKETKSMYFTDLFKFNKKTGKVVWAEYNYYGSNTFKVLNKEEYEKYLIQLEVNQECRYIRQFIIQNINTVKSLKNLRDIREIIIWERQFKNGN